MRKVAICGTAASSAHLAPVSDPAWEIWCVAPGSWAIPRWDRWYEVHDTADIADNGKWPAVYLRMLETAEGPVFMPKPLERFSTAIPFDQVTLLKEFGTSFFSSSVAWVLAQAIHEEADVIGLWGVDCASNEEWAHQRKDVLHFIDLAQRRGITVEIPPVSKLLWPERLYGAPQHPIEAAIIARRGELAKKLADLQGKRAAVDHEITLIQGAIGLADEQLLQFFGKDS